MRLVPVGGGADVDGGAPLPTVSGSGFEVKKALYAVMKQLMEIGEN